MMQPQDQAQHVCRLAQQDLNTFRAIMPHVPNRLRIGPAYNGILGVIGIGSPVTFGTLNAAHAN
jgi:hypothetical protein